MRLLHTICLAALSALAPALAAPQALTGTWCLKGEGLMLDFYGTDSVKVSSNAEEGIGGFGRYEKKDTMFVATITENDMTITMGYQYKFINDSTIAARTLFISLNGEAVNHPESTLTMVRCGTVGKPKKAAKETKKN